MVALAAAPAAGQRLIARLLGRWPALRARAHRVFDTFVHGLEGVRTWDHALPILVWTGIVWVIPALSAWTVLYAMNFHLAWLAGWTGLVFVGVGGSLPSAAGHDGG